MGKTVRRKTLKNNGYYDKTSRTARAYKDPNDVADNISILINQNVGKELILKLKRLKLNYQEQIKDIF